jgi:hypothetical protein
MAEPEPICVAIDHVRVRVAPGYVDKPAALDVSISAEVTCVDSPVWLNQVIAIPACDTWIFARTTDWCIGVSQSRRMGLSAQLAAAPSDAVEGVGFEVAA